MREAGPEIIRALGVQDGDIPRRGFYQQERRRLLRMGAIRGADGDAADAHNAGGTDERRAIIHALKDWGDVGGNMGTSPIHDSLMVVRGPALSRNASPPLFGGVNKASREMSPLGVTEIRIGNSGIHLYSEDWGPSYSKKEKAALAEMARGI